MEKEMNDMQKKGIKMIHEVKQTYGLPGALSLILPGLGQFVKGHNGEGGRRLAIATIPITGLGIIAGSMGPRFFLPRNFTPLMILAIIVYIIIAVRASHHAYTEEI